MIAMMSSKPSTTQVQAPAQANIVLWFQKNIGQSAGTWIDQSASAKDLTLTGNPSLSGGVYTFNGSAQGGATAAMTLNQPCTVGMRIKAITWVNATYIYDGIASDSNHCAFLGSSPQYEIYNGGTSLFNSSGFTIGSFDSMINVHNAGSSVVRINTTEFAAGATIGASNPGGFSVAQQGGGAAFGNIALAELVVYNIALDAGQRASLQAYLDTK